MCGAPPTAHDFQISTSSVDATLPEILFGRMMCAPRNVATSHFHQIECTQGTRVLDHPSDACREAVREAAETWATPQDRCRGSRRSASNDSPTTALRRVFAILGLPTEVGQSEATAARRTFERLPGRKNGEEDRCSFFRKGFKGNWPNVLDPWAVNVIVFSCRRGTAEMNDPT